MRNVRRTRWPAGTGSGINGQHPDQAPPSTRTVTGLRLRLSDRMADRTEGSQDAIQRRQRTYRRTLVCVWLVGAPTFMPDGTRVRASDRRGGGALLALLSCRSRQTASRCRSLAQRGGRETERRRDWGAREGGRSNRGNLQGCISRMNAKPSFCMLCEAEGGGRHGTGAGTETEGRRCSWSISCRQECSRCNAGTLLRYATLTPNDDPGDLIPDLDRSPAGLHEYWPKTDC